MSNYIHGFTKAEQNRLAKQSRFLEPYLYNFIDLSQSNDVLELGCGVGAQIQILLEHYPNLKIIGTDISEVQIYQAKERLNSYIKQGNVTLYSCKKNQLPFTNDTFDACIIFFVLEHTEEPIVTLKEVRRVMKKGSQLYCTEVFNSNLYIYPHCPSIEQYWEIYNNNQEELNGDPNIGIKLCNLAIKAGFSSTNIRYIPIHLDGATGDYEERENFLNYWLDLFLSATPDLLEKKKITMELIEKVKEEFDSLKRDLNSIFSYTAIQLKAIK